MSPSLAAPSSRTRVLAPADRFSEVVFGTIMAMTIVLRG